MAAACDKMDSETLKGNSPSSIKPHHTEASVFILPETIYKEHFAPCAVTEPKVKLVTYTKGDLPVIGCLQATVRVANYDKRATIIVKDGSTLLGLH